MCGRTTDMSVRTVLVSMQRVHSSSPQLSSRPRVPSMKTHYATTSIAFSPAICLDRGGHVRLLPAVMRLLPVQHLAAHPNPY